MKLVTLVMIAATFLWAPLDAQQLEWVIQEEADSIAHSSERIVIDEDGGSISFGRSWRVRPDSIDDVHLELTRRSPAGSLTWRHTLEWPEISGTLDLMRMDGSWLLLCALALPGGRVPYLARLEDGEEFLLTDTAFAEFPGGIWFGAIRPDGSALAVASNLLTLTVVSIAADDWSSTAETYSLGGGVPFRISGLSALKSGGWIAAGTMADTSGGSRGFLWRFDDHGDSVSFDAIGVPGDLHINGPYSVDGRLIVAGKNTTDDGATFEPFLAELDDAGHVERVRLLEGFGNGRLRPITAVPEGLLCLWESGVARTEFAIVDSSGTPRSTDSIPGLAEGASIVSIERGLQDEFYLSGYVNLWGYLARYRLGTSGVVGRSTDARRLDIR